MKLPIVALIIAILLLGAAGTDYAFSRENQVDTGCATGCNLDAHNSMAGMMVANASGMDNMPGMQTTQHSSAGSMPMHGGHMEMTPARPQTAADREKAADIISALRTAMEQFKDYRAAMAAGYEPFHPEIKMPIYHFTNMHNAFLNLVSFEPTRPTSLMYRPVPGGYELVGAMYTAPLKSSLDDLNQRVPLSIATWHLHVNLCLPPAGMEREMLQPHPQFGFAGSISTQAQCDAAGGRFKPTVFNWMVHVWPYETNPAKVWASEDHPGAMDN